MTEETKDIFHDVNGKELVDSKGAYARTTGKSYYVMEFMGELYKKGTTVRRLDVDRLKLIKVGPTCYKNYLTYLKTNRDTSYTLANRNPEN